MVLFYDLSASHHPPNDSSTTTTTRSTVACEERLNREHPLSRLLAAYPFLAGMAQWLDHTDLENLSAACWQFRENMGQYRRGLLRASLRCCNDGAGAVGGEEGGEGRERGAHEWSRFRGGSRCVRDMVAGCRGCGRPYCRNCVHKPSKATLDCRSVPPCLSCGARPPHPTTPPPCTCDSTTWICQGCVDARWYVGGRLCLLCHENPTRELYRWDLVGKWARTVCTWCDGMVWSAKDIKDMEDMEVLGTLEGLAVSTGATTAGEEEGIDTSLAFSL
ncbi:uncharacterized protein H6S33_010213 [Morchella sextelata]|uniref:uncharacterized protein n=1 Tax=Morchella sextelata TaxID=1174677 RepID=UPI001D059616|nr:uncharacterized protein H6S33_010213 [Morchella sextelata]KAH0612161.1 hypothetical protein H6S33_010213 [Morchella sextelata]